MEQIINYEIAEFVRFFGSVAGTPGVRQDVLDECNDYLMKLVRALEVNVDKAIQSNQSINTGLITQK